MTEEKPLCTVTHRQLVDGCCPWCHAPVSDGQLRGVSAGSTEACWNWRVLEEDLRAGDLRIRTITSLNLAKLSDEVEHALPLLTLALDDRHHDVRLHAEIACERIGRDLSSMQAVWLEGEVRGERHHLAACMMLLAGYSTSRQPELRAKRAAHICWLIEHHPHRRIAGIPDALLLNRDEPQWYEDAREQWIKTVGDSKSNAAVLGNAARFFMLNEPERAARLLVDSQTLEPENTEWHELLAQLHTLSARHGTVEDRAIRHREAMVELEMAEQIRSAHAGVVSDEEKRVRNLLTRVYTLPNRARAALDAGEWEFARQLARECLALASSNEIDEYFREDGNAIHYSHLVLGHVALHEGDLARAKDHLIASGKTEGSPNLDSFGPNMSLAKAILEKGDSTAVLQYLDLCGKFWNSGSDRLIAWKRQVAQGQVPDFGANLVY